MSGKFKGDIRELTQEALRAARASGRKGGRPKGLSRSTFSLKIQNRRLTKFGDLISLCLLLIFVSHPSIQFIIMELFQKKPTPATTGKITSYWKSWTVVLLVVMTMVLSTLVSCKKE